MMEGDTGEVATIKLLKLRECQQKQTFPQRAFTELFSPPSGWILPVKTNDGRTLAQRKEEALFSVVAISR